MTKVIFIESRRQALEAKRILHETAEAVLIAITAEATFALEQLKLPHKAAWEFVDFRDLASAEKQFILDGLNIFAQLETFVLERYLPANMDGPAFFTGESYWLLLIIGGVVTRTYMMWKAVQTYSPSSVLAFHEDLDPWFSGHGYEINPWHEAFFALCREFGVQYQLERLTKPISNRKRPKVRDWIVYSGRFVFKLAREIRDYLAKTRNFLHGRRATFRLLVADDQRCDWDYVFRRMNKKINFSLSRLVRDSSPHGLWAQCYEPVVYDNYLWNRKTLFVQPIHFDSREREVLSVCMDEWVAAFPKKAAWKVHGFDIFPALVPYLKSMLALSLPLARHANEIAKRILDAESPNAVCFVSTAMYSSKALAFHARKRGIPTIAYQHGGAYGTQVSPRHHLADFYDADYFLTYGDGVKPRVDQDLPTRVQFVPVGSARIEHMLKAKYKNRLESEPNILWVAELSTRNTLDSESPIEDTLRYRIQKNSLELLGSRMLNVVYRPFPQDLNVQATPDWIRHIGLPTVTQDSWRRLHRLILKADIVICDCSSSTTWNEVLAMGKPLLLYCDPRQTLLTDDFASDLDLAAYWCKSVPEFYEAIESLADSPCGFLEQIRKKPSEEFVRKYVLHNGDVVDNVVSFMSAVCRREYAND